MVLRIRFAPRTARALVQSRARLLPARPGSHRPASDEASRTTLAQTGRTLPPSSSEGEREVLAVHHASLDVFKAGLLHFFRGELEDARGDVGGEYEPSGPDAARGAERLLARPRGHVENALALADVREIQHQVGGRPEPA